MFQVPTFLLLCCSSDLSGEPEIKSWSAIFRTHKISKGMDQKPNPLPSELRHPGLVVFLKARKRVLDLPFSSSSSVSAAADVSERDVLESKEASSRSSFSSSSSVSAAADVSKKDVQLREKCIEICAIYLMAKNHILFLPFVLQLDLKLHLECERLKATERAP
jgi:hypothetical protein